MIIKFMDKVVNEISIYIFKQYRRMKRAVFDEVQPIVVDADENSYSYSLE